MRRLVTGTKARQKVDVMPGGTICCSRSGCMKTRDERTCELRDSLGFRLVLLHVAGLEWMRLWWPARYEQMSG